MHGRYVLHRADPAYTRVIELVTIPWTLKLNVRKVNTYSKLYVHKTTVQV